MATKNGEGVWIEPGVYIITWTGLSTGDVGTPMDCARLNEKCVHVTGVNGAAGTTVIQGSNDATNWVTLADPQGNALSIGASVIEQILENPRYVRPNQTAGDGTTSITVRIVARGGLV